MTDIAPDLNIDQRGGWPDELCVLLKDFPRENWRSTSSQMVHFWLDKHDFFRRQCSALQSATRDYREQRTTPREFAIWIAPRLQGFFAHLHGHAQIEDFHYFPAFRAAEQRLASGFDALAQDHELIHKGIDDIIAIVNEFITAISPDSTSNLDVQRQLGDRFADASEILYGRLLRHLDDEEDLIIPLMLDRGG